MVDNNLRVKLARAVNDQIGWKERWKALKTAFGGIQDANWEKTISPKTSLMVNGALDILMKLIYNQFSTSHSLTNLPTRCNHHNHNGGLGTCRDRGWRDQLLFYR